GPHSDALLRQAEASPEERPAIYRSAPANEASPEQRVTILIMHRRATMKAFFAGVPACNKLFPS
ncbi:hypothetical protein, partial [uncultured Trichococcus sp.]|uniref:hypothetical protein n=1 Tax=uncultured Trichococcus sp. TaxID=189665 RepID=UPI002594F761